MTAPILLIDDDDDLRSAVADLLEAMGHRVVSCADAQQALAQLQAGIVPSRALLDLMMPGRHGWELRPVLAGQPSWQRIPVVVMTAHVLGTPVRGSLEGLTVLGKPFTLEQMTAAIASATV